MDYNKICFAIMPFGKKPVGEREVDFDQIYDEIFEPAINAVPEPEEGAFYGEQCAAYLFGPKARLPYRMLYCLAILGGAAAGARAIWAWADLLNGVMAIPHLIALVVLGGEVGRMLLARGRASASG